MVADALCKLLKDSFAHVEDDKEELVRDVHRLAPSGVQFVDSSEGDVVVYNGFESSFLLDVMAKHDLCSIIVDLKKSVSKKAIKASSLGREGIL
ncbi:hypothetical protein MTR67_022974 [Solanum verrucosum]|uniref:Uncharacterized protein n=1 Tax=Solanum verrucosum TaxID=315347 RepID=A0AAF0TRS2_SOLVR|nr:hypothetical protein MTR67_022974 [Solanum verrucosum]